MGFKDPWLLLLIPLVWGLVIWNYRRTRVDALRFPSAEFISALAKSWRVRFIHTPFLLRLVALGLILVALAGPRSVLDEVKHESEGIDIVLALDASGSMAAEDFTLNGTRFNRFEVVKKVVEEFINARSSDRIGLIAFAGLAYTVSPLTTDYTWLKSNLERLHLNMMEDGTAIGSALTASLSRLEKSKAKSKVIILLTDGVNNKGKIEPLTAAKAAQALGVKIYTIGAGTNGLAPYPVQDIWGRKGYQNAPVEIDEQTLSKIADMTHAKYFRATDTESLRRVYKDIDQLEKTKIEESGYRDYRELFGLLLGPGLFILLLAYLLENTILMRIP